MNASDLMKLPKDLRHCILERQTEGVTYKGGGAVKELVEEDDAL